MKTEIKKAGENIGYSYSAVVLGQFLCMPLSIFYISMLTRTLGPEKFGYFTIFLAAAQFFFCVFANWTRNSIIRFGSDAFATGKDIGEVITSQSVITFCSLLISLTIIISMRSYLQDILSLGENSYLWIALYLSAFILADFAIYFSHAMHRYLLYAVTIFLRPSILIVLFILIFIVLKYTSYISIVIIIEIISYLLIFGFLFGSIFWHKRFPLTFSFSKKIIIEILRYSRPVIIMVLLGYSILWMDIWMIKYFLNYKAVGEYEAANRLMQMVSNTIMPLTIVGFPLMVSLKSIESTSRIYIFATTIVPQFCFFWSLIILILLFNSKNIVNIILGNDFSSSLFTFQLLLVGASFQILTVLYSTILQAYDWTKRIAIIAIVSAMVNLFLNFILIPRWGINGAALSKAGTMAVASFLSANSAVRCLQVKKNNYYVYIFLSIPALTVLSLYILKDGFFHFLSTIILCSLAILIVKKNKVFSEEGWSFWEKIKMPVFVKSTFKKIYGVFV